MKKRTFMTFLAPDDGSQGGNNAVQDPATTAGWMLTAFEEGQGGGGATQGAPDPQQQQQQQTTQQQQYVAPQTTQQQQAPTTQQAVTQVAPAFNPADVAQIAAQTAAQVLAQQPQQRQQEPQRQLTQAEIDAQFGVPRITEAHIQKIFAGGAEGAKVLEDVLHMSARMGASVAQAAYRQDVDARFAQITPQLQAAASFAEQQAREMHTREFFKFAPDLQPYSEICQLVYADLDRRGIRFPDAFTAYKTVAEITRQTVQRTNPAFQPGVAPTAQQPSRRQMTTLPSGGSGGLGGQAAAQSKSAGMAVFAP